MRHCAVPLAAALVAASGLSAGCAARQPDVLGRSVILVPADARAAKPKGELLAVDEERLWLRTKDGVREFPRGAVVEVRVRRHGFGGGLAKRVGLIGGLVSGLALTAACSSVEDNEGGGCAAAGFGVGAVWAITGLLASPGLDASAHARLPSRDERLRAYARFPAGLPKDVPPQSLVAGPPAPK